MEASLRISTDTASCKPLAKSELETPTGDEEIGAIWRQESLPSQDSDLEDDPCTSDVRQLSSKDLDRCIDFFRSQRGSSKEFSGRCISPVEGSAALKETIQQVMTQMQGVANKDNVSEPLMGVSVHACRALIEMMVSVDEIPIPTVNITNRAPCAPAADDSDLIFSTDDLIY